MTDVNVNLKVPALEKLLDYAASGIGAVAGPMLAGWKARRDAEAKRITGRANADARVIEAKGDAATMRILSDAQAQAQRSLCAPIESGRGTIELSRDGIRQRIEFQEQKRQHNIVSVTLDAAANLGDKVVSNHPVDPDWTARFFDNVQDVSANDMKKLWSKILSGEVECPGRTSLRTLDVLRNMTSKDAQVFNDISHLVINDFIFYEAGQAGDSLPLDKLLHLQNCGLVNVSRDLAHGVTFADDDDPAIFVYQNFALRVRPIDNACSSVQIPCLIMTIAGHELLLATERQFRLDYLRSLSKFLRTKKCELTKAQILGILSDGRYRCGAFVPIER